MLLAEFSDVKPSSADTLRKHTSIRIWTLLACAFAGCGEGSSSTVGDVSAHAATQFEPGTLPVWRAQVLSEVEGLALNEQGYFAETFVSRIGTEVPVTGEFDISGQRYAQVGRFRSMLLPVSALSERVLVPADNLSFLTNLTDVTVDATCEQLAPNTEGALINVEPGVVDRVIGWSETTNFAQLLTDHGPRWVAHNCLDIPEHLQPRFASYNQNAPIEIGWEMEIPVLDVFNRTRPEDLTDRVRFVFDLYRPTRINEAEWLGPGFTPGQKHALLIHAAQAAWDTRETSGKNTGWVKTSVAPVFLSDNLYADTEAKHVEFHTKVPSLTVQGMERQVGQLFEATQSIGSEYADPKWRHAHVTFPITDVDVAQSPKDETAEAIATFILFLNEMELVVGLPQALGAFSSTQTQIRYDAPTRMPSVFLGHAPMTLQEAQRIKAQIVSPEVVDIAESNRFKRHDFGFRLPIDRVDNNRIYQDSNRAGIELRSFNLDYFAQTPVRISLFGRMLEQVQNVMSLIGTGEPIVFSTSRLDPDQSPYNLDFLSFDSGVDWIQEPEDNFFEREIGSGFESLLDDYERLTTLGRSGLALEDQEQLNRYFKIALTLPLVDWSTRPFFLAERIDKLQEHRSGYIQNCQSLVDILRQNTNVPAAHVYKAYAYQLLLWWFRNQPYVDY